MRALLRRRGLAYPGSFRPGFDPSHVAASGTTFSAISQGNNFVNILNSARCTIVGTPTASIRAGIGPSVFFTGTSDQLTYTASTTAAPVTSITFGAILIGNTGGVFVSDTGAAFNSNLVTMNGGNLQLFTGGAANSGFSLSATVPYFIAISNNGTSANFVAVNLNTGQVQTSTVAGVAPSSVDAVYGIGNYGSAPLVGYLAAIAYTNRYTSMPALRSWAADPWSFWYPATDLPVLVRAASSSVIVPTSGPVFSDFAQTTYDTIILS